ncbi:MAG: hypothetical protein EA411_06060 [Saprospirales bacterium]|nr:MAG: hypothetical protein EA411_06060 [Saprospirales bacterium]
MIMLKPYFQLSVLDGVDFFFLEDNSDGVNQEYSEDQKVHDNPFNICMRSRMMLEPEWEELDFI